MEDKELFILVESLVKEAFGDEFFCNVLMDSCAMPMSLDHPCDVSTGYHSHWAGTFTDDRGEELVLYSGEYVTAGKTYARLYKEATGRNVKLLLKHHARIEKKLEEIVVD